MRRRIRLARAPARIHHPRMETRPAQSAAIVGAVESRPGCVARRPPRVLGALERPGDVFRHLGPNWFASVMGTGIVANAAALLPVHVPGLRPVAVGAWLLAATMLVVLTAATGMHWLRYPENARRHHHDPTMAPFYGAPP